MLKIKVYTYLSFLILGITMFSCYKEYTYEQIVVEHKKACDDLTWCEFGYIFDFYMTQEQELNVYNTSSRITIQNPGPKVTVNDYNLLVDRLSVRGESSLNFRRKSFTLNLDNLLTLTDSAHVIQKSFTRMKLLSMVFDYTYIESRIAYRFLQEAGVWPLYTSYAQVRINNNHQGLYLLVEDPEEYCLDKLNNGFIMRRGYNHGIDRYEYKPEMARYSEKHYTAMFRRIYNDIVYYSGQQLYDSLSAIMNVERYFRKLAVDYILKNGDATDEVFFYADESDEKARLQVIPWDYDDIFAPLPHEIGRSWGPGTLFGTRYYASMEDVIADIGVKHIFSVEEDLDYKIAKDDFLYAKYLHELTDVLNIIDENFINQVFDDIETELAPFYKIDDIIQASQYDVDATTEEAFWNNIIDKREFLLNRRAYIVELLNNE